MFEDLITVLEGLGAEYTEDYEEGTLTIEVANLDKVQIINIIQAVNDSDLDFSVDEKAIVVIGEAMPEPMEEEPMDGELDEEEGMMMNQEAAMNEMFGG